MEVIISFAIGDNSIKSWYKKVKKIDNALYTKSLEVDFSLNWNENCSDKIMCEIILLVFTSNGFTDGI